MGIAIPKKELILLLPQNTQMNGIAFKELDWTHTRRRRSRRPAEGWPRPLRCRPRRHLKFFILLNSCQIFYLKHEVYSSFIELNLNYHDSSTVWGSNLFCNMFFLKVLLLAWAASQRPVELSENILQNIFNKLPPQIVVIMSRKM